MLPPTHTGFGPARKMWAMRLVVVVFPLLPVTPMMGAGQAEEQLHFAGDPRAGPPQPLQRCLSPVDAGRKKHRV